MKSVSVSTLKARLSEFLSAVKEGEEVVITEHGTPVARILPLGGAAGGEARLETLVRTGLARAPAGPVPDDFWSLCLPADPHASVRSAVLEERSEGR